MSGFSVPLHNDATMSGPLVIYPKVEQKKKKLTAKKIAKTVAKAPFKLAVKHPDAVSKYALPLALSTLSAPVISALPLGPFGPMVAFIAVACGRFKMRQELMGGGYALIQATGMAGLKGQALSLLGLVGLEATGSRQLRDCFMNSIFESNVGIRAQVIGLAIAALTTTTGAFGSLGSMIGARAMSLLFAELRAFATFHGLRWAASNLQGLWLTFTSAGSEAHAAFLSYMLGQTQKVKVDDAKREEWAREILYKIATKIPFLPVQAMAPEMAAILKAWEQELEQKPVGRESEEPIDEWVHVEREDENLSVCVPYEEDEEYEDLGASTADLAAYAAYADDTTFADTIHHPSREEYTDNSTFVDTSHHRSREENLRELQQVAREPFEQAGLSEYVIQVALQEMGLGDDVAVWGTEANSGTSSALASASPPPIATPLPVNPQPVLVPSSSAAVYNAPAPPQPAPRANGVKFTYAETDVEETNVEETDVKEAHSQLQLARQLTHNTSTKHGDRAADARTRQSELETQQPSYHADVKEAEDEDDGFDDDDDDVEVLDLNVNDHWVGADMVYWRCGR